MDLIQHSPLYTVLLAFFAAYPLVTSIMWITTAQFFRGRWEKDEQQDAPPALDPASAPMVSVVIPAFNEERVIGAALEAVCRMSYPNFEVVVVDDGSTDGTLRVVEPFVRQHGVRLIRKEINEGKAMALNDALPCLNGEILLLLDADAAPEPELLHHMVPHFALARTAAVTGNPRVANVDTFLARLQLIEFTSIVSLLRRSQRIWGRIQTISGVICALRKSAMIDVGGFSPDMATEDIELTWKLQKRFWDVRYEPRAIIWMTVPTSYRGLFRQRLRWARGLAQVMRRHWRVITQWKCRRMWPIFVESVMSISWSVCFFGFTLLWAVSHAVGYPPIGANPMPNLWGMTIATVCIAQLAWGTLVDARYDRDTPKFLPYAVYYPIIYWMFLALCAVLAIPHLFRRPAKQSVRWSTTRPGEGAGA